MKSIRTTLPKTNVTDFRIFLDTVGLQEVLLGSYEDINHKWYKQDYICCAYSEKSAEVVAILTYISLKYGSLHGAFSDYMRAIETSAVNDPYFIWTP